LQPEEKAKSRKLKGKRRCADFRCADVRRCADFRCADVQMGKKVRMIALKPEIIFNLFIHLKILA